MVAALGSADSSYFILGSVCGVDHIQKLSSFRQFHHNAFKSFPARGQSSGLPPPICVNVHGFSSSGTILSGQAHILNTSTNDQLKFLVEAVADKMPGVVKFDPKTGHQFKPKSFTLTYIQCLVDSFIKEADIVNKILAIPAALGDGTGLPYVELIKEKGRESNSSNSDVDSSNCTTPQGSEVAEKKELGCENFEKQVPVLPVLEIALMNDMFSNLLLGEDKSGRGHRVPTTLVISNAITYLCATLFGQIWRLKPLPPEKTTMWTIEMKWFHCVNDHFVELKPTWQTFSNGSKLEVITYTTWMCCESKIMEELLAETIRRNCYFSCTTWSLHFKQWDPGGCYFVH